MMSIHSWETDIEFLSFHLSKEGIVNGPLSLSKLLRWTFKHSLIAIIHHAFSDKTIIVWSPFSFEAITFLVQISKVEGAKKILSRTLDRKWTECGLHFWKTCPIPASGIFFYEYVQLVQKLILGTKIQTPVSILNLRAKNNCSLRSRANVEKFENVFVVNLKFEPHYPLLLAFATSHGVNK